MCILPQLKKNDASDKQESQLHRVAECTKLQGNLTWSTNESSSAKFSAPRWGISRHGGQKETGDWRQWYPNHKLYARVIWVLSEHQSKTGRRAFGHRSHLSQPLLFSHKHNSSQLFLLSSGKWVSPHSGWSRADPCTLGLQRSLWEDVNSAPSLLSKRVTRDLLDPWSRAWSTGSVRGAEVKSCSAGADLCPKTKEGSPWAEKTTVNPWVVGVGRRLRGPEASAKFLSALNMSVVTVTGFSKMFLNWGNVQMTSPS